MSQKKTYIVIISILIISLTYWVLFPGRLKDFKSQLSERLNLVITQHNDAEIEDINKNITSINENMNPIYIEEAPETTPLKNNINGSEPDITIEDENIVNNIISEEDEIPPSTSVPSIIFQREKNNIETIINKNSQSVLILISILEIEKVIITGNSYKHQFNLLQDLIYNFNNENIKETLLGRYANTGLPSNFDLYNEFKKIKLLIVSKPKNELQENSFISKIYNKTKSLFLVINRNNIKDRNLESSINKIEKAIQKSNLNEIIIEFNLLSEFNKKLLNNWIKKIKIKKNINLQLLKIRTNTIKNMTNN